MNIREFRQEDTNKIIAVMCEAFIKEDLYCFFVEDVATRKKFLKKFMHFRLKFGIKKGKVFVSDDCESVVILIMPHQKMSFTDLLLSGGLAAMLCCKAEQRQRMMQFNAFAEVQNQQSIAPPFWHISPLCVSPKKQGQGYGTALMQYSLATIKASAQPCYLETQSQKNTVFYEKFGFETVCEAKMPGTNLVNYAMVHFG